MSGKENTSNRGGGYRHGRAQAAFYEELLCCYTCGKIYFTRHPIKLAAPSHRTFHVCIECSHTLRCFGCGEQVTSKTAVVVESPPDHPGDIFCAKCRNQGVYNPPRQPEGFGARVRFALATTLESVKGFFRGIGGIPSRFRRR